MIGILGGGLAGLTIAANLKQPCEVLEAAARGGGHCDTVCEDGFTYDAGGPHIIFSRDESILREMIALLGDNVLRRRRNNKIYFKGRFVKYPFENGLYELEPQDRFECLHHYLCNSHPAPTNFAEWMYHTFGSGITEKYLLPYNEKIWKTPARDMSIDWVDGRIPRPPLEDIVKSAVGVETEGYTHQLHFWYPAHGGIEQLPAALNKRVARFTPSFVVNSIRKVGSDWHVSNGVETRVYERLVCTIPLNTMARVVDGVPESVRTATETLRYNSLMTVTLGVRSSDAPQFTAVYVPAPEFIFHRISFPAVFSPHNAPEGTWLVQAEVTGFSGQGAFAMSDRCIVERVTADLTKMGMIDPRNVIYSRVITCDHGYVVRDFNCARNLVTARDYFEKDLEIRLCGRVAEFEYINMDQCMQRAMRVAKELDGCL